MALSATSVQTELNYHLTLEQGGTDSIYPGTASYYRQKYDTQPASVTDLRSIENESPASLDIQGFQLVKHTCSEKEWTDAARIRDVAYEETKELLMKAYVPIIPQKRIFKPLTPVQDRRLKSSCYFAPCSAPHLGVHARIGQRPEGRRHGANGAPRLHDEPLRAR